MTAEGERKNTTASMKHVLGGLCASDSTAEHPGNVGVGRRGGVCALTSEQHFRFKNFKKLKKAEELSTSDIF